MFISFGYLVFSLRKIYLFFSEYIKTSNFTYVENMANIYVPWILVIIVLVLLILSISILLLMNKKEKPVLFYKIMIAYCIFLLAIFIYYMTFFKSLDNTLYEPLRIAVNRDIALFAYIFNFFFVAFTFIRGFGFDIKKFSFDRDKRELNLEESDSEEYEVNVKIEKEDIKSFLNRHKREFKYYVKENKSILIIIGVIILVSFGLYFYYDRYVINKEYEQNDYVSVGERIYHVNSSRISNMDKYGQDLGEENDYLVIDMSITYNGGDAYLDSEALRIHIDDEYYYPIATCDLFDDIGNCYNKTELKKEIDNNFIFVYRIKKEYNDIFLEILKNKGDEYKYSKVKLVYTKDEIREENVVDNTITLKNREYTVENITLSEKASYQYEECVEDKCTTYTRKITPNTGEMVLTVVFDTAEGLSYDYLNSALGFKYFDRMYTGKEVQLVDMNFGTLYYTVPIYIKSVTSLDIYIVDRPFKYILKMQGEENE